MADEIDQALDQEAEALMKESAAPHYVRPWQYTPKKDQKYWREKALAARQARSGPTTS